MTRSRELAAIMFTNIQGYMSLMQQNEGKAIRAHEKHRHVFNSITWMHDIRILQYYDDVTLAFATALLMQCKTKAAVQGIKPVYSGL